MIITRRSLLFSLVSLSIALNRRMDGKENSLSRGIAQLQTGGKKIFVGANLKVKNKQEESNAYIMVGFMHVMI